MCFTRRQRQEYILQPYLPSVSPSHHLSILVSVQWLWAGRVPIGFRTYERAVRGVFDNQFLTDKGASDLFKAHIFGGEEKKERTFHLSLLIYAAHVH